MKTNEPVAVVRKLTIGGIDNFPIERFTELKEGTLLYTHPAKENTDSYMVEVLNNTLNMERNHNEKAYKELYALCEKLAKENEALKAKTLTDEEIEIIAKLTMSAYGNQPWLHEVHLIDFARAILRKAQEK